MFYLTLLLENVSFASYQTRYLGNYLWANQKAEIKFLQPQLIARLLIIAQICTHLKWLAEMSIKTSSWRAQCERSADSCRTRTC